MKKRYCILVAAVVSLIVLSQGVCAGQIVRFDSEKWSFGRIEETGGEVKHTFRFVNTSDKPVVIERVTTSCGCTAADYPRRPIASGKEGSLTVSFNPNGLPGRFDKTVNVAFTGHDEVVRLTITGTVNPRPRSIEDDYPFMLAGGVRAETLNRSFGYVAQGKTIGMTIGITNTSDSRVELDTLWTSRSGLLRFDYPGWLEAGEKGLLTLTYDLSDRVRYGLLNDCIRLVVDGRMAEMPFTVSGVAVDDFVTDATTKPKAEYSSVFHDFGLVRRGKSVKVEVELTNRGTEPLVVRSVEPRGNTVFGLHAGDVVAPNSTVRVVLKMNIFEDDFDRVFGGAIIVTNDPERPMRELRLAAEIEQN